MLNLLHSEISNSLAVVQHLLHELKVKVNKSTIKENLESHPEYPSLLAISDCLTTFKINNYSYKIVKGNYQKADLTFPFITHSQVDGGKFILVQSIDAKGHFKISDEKHKNLIIEESKFLENWTEIILQAEPDVKSGETDFNAKRIESIVNKLALPIFFILLTITAASIYKTNSFQWPILCVCIIKLMGIIITVLLLSNSINQNNPVVRKLCAFGGNDNCNSLLNSKASLVTSWLSWSEIGFFYFSGTFLTLLIFPELAPLLQFLNIVTIPFIIFSLCYQYRNKNWCTLCCVVQALLFTECMIFNFSFELLSVNFYFNASLFSSLLICFLLPITAWYILKPWLRKASSASSLQSQLNKFKFNTEIFNWMLTTQQFLRVDNNLLPVTIGNLDATNVITVVSNITCTPCKEAHIHLEELLEQRDDLQIQLLFVNDNKENDYRTLISQHLIALGLSKDSNKIIHAINDVYGLEERDFEYWVTKYPATITEGVRLANTKQKKWLIASGIIYTPIILVNGYILPELYNIQDLRYLII